MPQNHVEATKWFRLAAEQGDALAQYDLAQRYELGVGTTVDRSEALKWFLLAAAQGQPDAVKRVDQAKSKMSRDEIAEANRRVAAFSATNSTKPSKP
jgi:TPR repeat protein